LVIVDEIHRALSPKYSEVFEGFTTKALLGLSATPPEKKEQEELLNRVCPVVYVKEVSQAVEEGMAPEVQTFNLNVSMDKSSAAKYKVFDAKLMQSTIKLSRALHENQFLKAKYKSAFDLAREAKNGGFDRELELAAKAFWASMTLRKGVVYNNPHKIPVIRQIVNNDPDRKWIIFSKSITFAEKVKEVLPQAFLYHSKLSTKEREQVLENFNLLDKGVLISVEALNEGLDVSKVSGAICAAGVSTRLTDVQQRGRINRPEKDKKPIFINLCTKETVEKSWIDKKLKASKSSYKWIDRVDELPRQLLNVS
jgi:superfamily II DNA or RNA helicase